MVLQSPSVKLSLGSALVQRARHPKALLTDRCTDAGKMGVPLVSGAGHSLQGCVERGATRAWRLFLSAKALGLLATQGPFLHATRG